MSWQESYRRSYPCDCGKGTITVIGESDDWNRSREETTNSCEECKEKGRLLREQQITYRSNRENRIKVLDNEIKSTIQNLYSNEWLIFANRFKTKKSVHKFIRENKLDHISESSFYQHNRKNSTYTCVENLLTPAFYARIIQFIVDEPNKDLLESIAEIDSLYGQKNKEEMNALLSSYHGR